MTRYNEGERYPAAELDNVHVGHGGMVYQGLTNGHDTFRCVGCGDTCFYPVGPGLTARAKPGKAAS